MGRPPGALNRRTQEILDLIKGRGDTDPLDALSTLITTNKDPSIIAQASSILAPYVHSKRVSAQQHFRQPHLGHVREGHPEQRADTLCDRGRDECARQPRAQLPTAMERRAELGPAGDQAQPQDRRSVDRPLTVGPHSTLVSGAPREGANLPTPNARPFIACPPSATPTVSGGDDRMPLILRPDDYSRWLSDEPDPRGLMRPFLRRLAPYKAYGGHKAVRGGMHMPIVPWVEFMQASGWGQRWED
jgi:hypothetical protein